MKQFTILMFKTYVNRLLSVMAFRLRSIISQVPVTLIAPSPLPRAKSVYDISRLSLISEALAFFTRPICPHLLRPALTVQLPFLRIAPHIAAGPQIFLVIANHMLIVVPLPDAAAVREFRPCGTGHCRLEGPHDGPNRVRFGRSSWRLAEGVARCAPTQKTVPRQGEYGVEMIRHNNRRVGLEIRPQPHRCFPFAGNNLAERRQLHRPMTHYTKQARLPGCADRKEIPPVSGVIKPGKANTPSSGRVRLE